jgi:hypothetical protein
MFEGRADGVNSIALSANERWALLGCENKSLRLWELEWDCKFPKQKDWDEGARPHIENFLTLHTPYASTERDARKRLLRCGHPSWDDNDWLRLLETLQRSGYGWLNPDGVRRELEKMTAEWQGPPPMPWARENQSGEPAK